MTARIGIKTFVAFRRRASVTLRCLSSRLRDAAPRAAGLPLAVVVLLGACAPDARLAEPLPAQPLEAHDRSSAGGLVYVVADPEDDRRTDVWRARLSDGAVQPLIQTPERSEAWPDWSERASALVMQTRPAQSSMLTPGRLVLWKAGNEIELPGARARRESWAVWAPLDARLAYGARRLQPAGSDPMISSAIAVVDVETEEQTILVRSTQGERYARPAFSPDGGRLVAQYITRRPRGSQVVLIEDGGEPRLLTQGETFSIGPVFTRDGRHILFSRRNAAREPRDVLWMRSDGSELKTFASTPESDEGEPAGSPTRDEVVFVSDRDGKRDAYLVPLGGGPLRNLTKTLPFDVDDPRWSPGGERIALSAFPHEPDSAKEDRERPSRSEAQVLVIDRQGNVVFRTSGFSPDWMPPWG